jgi:uncharacterized protein (TIGR02246 family)
MKMTQAIKLGIITIALYAVMSAAPADTNREADHAALRELRNKVSKAINSQDVDGMAACFAKEFAFTTVTQSVLTSRAQVQEYFDKTFRSKDALIANMTTEPTADILTRFIDENTGVCYGSTKDTYTLKSGGIVTMNNRWSATVVKENGEWKVALAHVGTDFLNNPVLDRAESFAKKLALGTGFGGLVLGFFLGALICRGKKASGAATA